MRDDANRLRVWWSLSGLCLIAATWRLWTPQREFPQVPLFAWAGSLPAMWDWLCLAIVCGGLLCCPWFVKRSPSLTLRVRWLSVLIGLIGLWLVDQHRLQPWAWQLGLLAIVFGLDADGHEPMAVSRKPLADFQFLSLIRGDWISAIGFRLTAFGRTLSLIRVLTISIYFWSAVSKLDPLFAATHGQTLVGALLGVISIRVSEWPASLRWWSALGLPMFELCVALGLCVSRIRRWAMWGAIGLHVGLLLALGPWGLGHSAGVLVWNVAFIGHDWLLFGRSSLTRSVSEGECSPGCHRGRALWSVRPRLRVGLVLFACAWPIGQPLGWCDQWLAWSVYSVRTSQVSVMLSAEGVARLPPPTQPLVASGELRLDRWSLGALNVPIYPELRFQLGVADGLRRQVGDENLLELVAMSPTSRWSRDRVTQRWTAVRSEQPKFWINSTPRR